MVRKTQRLPITALVVAVLEAQAEGDVLHRAHLVGHGLSGSYRLLGNLHDGLRAQCSIECAMHIE